MKKSILTYGLITFASLITQAQDVIVQKDGSTIISRVLEVNQSDIKYKKFSNLNGPTYTINKFDIMSINYENGDKDTFENTSKQGVLSGISNDITSPENDGHICFYNDRSVRTNLPQKDKKAKWVYRILRVHPNSLIANKDIKLLVNIDQSKGLGDKAYFKVSIENNSNKIIYVDLENCTYRVNKSASKYFVNSSTTKTSGSEGGASVNMGSIASVLGVGGALGTIASGVNVGGSRNSGTSTTIYADRIITVAPHSIYTLPQKSFYDSDLTAPYSTDFKYGEHKNFMQPEHMSDTPWEFLITYATQDELDNLRQFNLGIYISDEFGISSSWDDDIKSETSTTPLHYCFKIKGW